MIKNKKIVILRQLLGFLKINLLVDYGIPEVLYSLMAGITWEDSYKKKMTLQKRGVSLLVKVFSTLNNSDI